MSVQVPSPSLENQLAPRPGRWRLRHLLVTWAGVLGVLGAIDWYVAHVFVPTRLVPRYERPGHPLRDTTGGQNLGILFRLAELRAATRRPFLALVGDSTVMGFADPEPTHLSTRIAALLTRARGDNPPIDVTEFGFPGLPSWEAAVVMAKILSLDPDLVFYSVTPRIMCRAGGVSANDASYVMEAGVAARLGPGLLLRDFLFDLPASAVVSHWDLYQFRREIGDALRATASSYLPSVWQGPRGLGLYAPRIIFAPPASERVLWTRTNCSLDPDSGAVRALTRIVEMCAASERCLLYHSPLNPSALAQFDTGLLPGFISKVRDLTTRYDVPFVNYASSVRTSAFNPPKLNRLDAVHLNSRGRDRLADYLAAEALRLLPPVLTRQADASHGGGVAVQ